MEKNIDKFTCQLLGITKDELKVYIDEARASGFLAKRKPTPQKLIDEDMPTKWNDELGGFNIYVYDFIESFEDVDPNGHYGYQSVSRSLGITDKHG